MELVRIDKLDETPLAQSQVPSYCEKIVSTKGFAMKLQNAPKSVGSISATTAPCMIAFTTPILTGATKIIFSTFTAPSSR